MTILAAISEGHTDLADLLFLIAFIAFVAVAALVVIAKPINLVHLAAAVGAALIALAWFVL